MVEKTRSLTPHPRSQGLSRIEGFNSLLWRYYYGCFFAMLLQRCLQRSTHTSTEGRTRDLGLMRGLRQHYRGRPRSFLLLCAAIALGRPNVCVFGFVHQSVPSTHIAASSLGCNSSGQASSAVRSTEARQKTRETTRHGGLTSRCTSSNEIRSENARCEGHCVHILWA